MKATSYYVTPGGGLESLQPRLVDVPTPTGRQALVRVVATSLNYRERMIITHGVYPLPLKAELVPVCDGAGEVVAVGPDAKQLKIGDRVAASVFPRWLDGPFAMRYADQLGGSLDGMLTEYALLDEDALVPIPAHLSYEEAAAYPCAGVTAWHALTWGPPPSPGSTVLVLGSGGVSLFALQFAKLFGARVIATTSSRAKVEQLRALGADEVVDSGDVPDWDRAVRELTNGRGVDRVIDVGGATTLARSIAATMIEGHIALVGGLGGLAPIDASALAGVFTLHRVSLGNRAHFEAMNRAVAFAQSRPVIDRVFTFDQAREAFAYYFDQQAMGKVIVRVAA